MVQKTVVFFCKDLSTQVLSVILKLVRQISSIQISRLGMDGDRINFLTHNWGQTEDLLDFRLCQFILLTLSLIDSVLKILSITNVGPRRGQ